jgi:drug/metabolite transporter (DMT)-like permease
MITAQPMLPAVSGGLMHLQPHQLLGIPIALLGAVLMSFGTQYQSRGLNKVEQITRTSAASGLNLRHIFHLLGRPSWLVGTVMLGLAVAFQIGSLSLSPLIVVQPLGVVALIVTAVLNSRVSHVKLQRPVVVAITMCVFGIVAFVSVAAFTASEEPVTGVKLAIILVIFAAVATGLFVAFLTFRHRPIVLLYVVGAGVLYGFVATFAKSVLVRIIAGEWDGLTWMAIIALVAGAVFGMVFVQNAHSSGPPDLVIAGLTVIDPIIAVLIGVAVLGEARQAPLWAAIVFIVSGLIAALGVFGIARFHPQARQASIDARKRQLEYVPKGDTGHSGGADETSTSAEREPVVIEAEDQHRVRPESRQARSENLRYPTDNRD